jgi:hypothetical protein
MTTAAKEALEALTECLQKNNQMTMKRAAWLVTIKSSLTPPTAPEDVAEAVAFFAEDNEPDIYADGTALGANGMHHIKTLITAATSAQGVQDVTVEEAALQSPPTVGGDAPDVAGLVEALQWYADVLNYRTEYTPAKHDDTGQPWMRILEDSGNRAREALAAHKKRGG